MKETKAKNNVTSVGISDDFLNHMPEVLRVKRTVQRIVACTYYWEDCLESLDKWITDYNEKNAGKSRAAIMLEFRRGYVGVYVSVKEAGVGSVSSFCCLKKKEVRK